MPNFQPALPGPPPLNYAARTAIHLALFLHLAAVVIAILATGPASALEQRIHLVTRWYTQLLHMDLPYAFSFTQGGELDVDFVLEADIKQADGTIKQVSIPERRLAPGPRYRHRERLAWQTAYQVFLAEQQVTDEEREDVLPRAVAAHLLAKHNATELTLRCRGHLLQLMPDLDSNDPDVRNPYHESYYYTHYEARAWIADGQVQLLPKATGVDAAPAADAE